MSLMGIEDSDIEKIADVVNKKRKPYRWYNDAEKAKKVGPIIETLCYVFGFGLFVVSFIMIASISMGVPILDNENDQFTNIALANMDCESLKTVSHEYIHSEKESRLSHSYIQADINAEILSRC